MSESREKKMQRNGN